MGAELLDETSASQLRAAPFTYAEIGATRSVLPQGYTHLERSRVLPLHEFEVAAQRLMAWRVHEVAGIRMSASTWRAEPGSVVAMELGPRWIPVRAVCRVVYVIDEPNRVGFAYGTLPGHPESGEESFVVQRLDGAATFTVRAFSRPATRLARLGGPVTRFAQSVMTARYLDAIAPTQIPFGQV